MKNKIYCVFLVILILLFCTTSAFANSLEFNDVNIYVNNIKQQTVALRTDTDFQNGSTAYFDVALNVNTLKIVLCMQGGQPITTNVSVNGLSQVSSGSRTIQFIQSGTLGGVSGQNAQNFFRVFFTIDRINWPQIDISINQSAVQLSSPTLTFNNNVLSWNSISNASAYRIQFSSDGHQYNIIINSTQSTNYTISQSGYYSVQALGQGSFYSSDWSNSLQCEYVPGSSDGGIVNWFQSTIERFTTGIQNFFSSISSVVSNLGEIFTGITSFLPTEYSTIIWSLAGLLLMFGLFRLIF